MGRSCGHVGGRWWAPTAFLCRANGWRSVKPDLTLLYSQMGLKPNCSLAELQLAYRRRISELQPNPMDAGSQSPESHALLRNLIWLYTTASRFHRRYGRLPGAAPVHARADHWDNAKPQHAYATEDPPAPLGNRQEPQTRGVLWLAFLVVLLLCLLAWAGALNW